MMLKPPHRLEAGFTLLELLVSVTLLAFLSAALVAGLRFGTRIWNRAENANLDTNAVRAAQKTLAQDLAHIYPKFVVVSPTDSFVDFTGSPHRMEYLSPADQGSGGLMLTGLDAVNDDGGWDVQYTTAPELARPGTPANTTVLLRHLTSLEFAYFGASGGDKIPAWHEEWRHEVRLPLLIRVRAAAPHATAAWTELVVRPKIAADVECRFDPVTKFCQGR